MRTVLTALLKSAVLAMGSLTILAVCYLSLSVLILQPPKVDYASASIAAALFVGLSALTLVAASLPDAPAWLRLLAAAAGVLLVVLGAWTIQHTLASDHFEGYALLLGGMLAVQGVLTAAYFMMTTRSGPRNFSSSVVNG